MILHNPFKISSRLLPCVEIGGATVSLSHVGYAGGRMVFRWFIDLPNGEEYSESDLKSGCQGASLQEMFGTLLAFLGACADSRRYAAVSGREGENTNLFPEAVGAWAEENEGEISALQYEIEESGAELIEE